MVDVCGTGLDTAEDTDSELEGRRREAPGVGSDHVLFRRPNQTWGRDEKVQQRDWCPQSTDQSPERKSSEQVTDAASDSRKLAAAGRRQEGGPGRHLGSAKRQRQGDRHAHRRNARVRPPRGERQRDAAAMKDTSPDAHGKIIANMQFRLYDSHSQGWQNKHVFRGQRAASASSQPRLQHSGGRASTRRHEGDRAAKGDQSLAGHVHSHPHPKDGADAGGGAHRPSRVATHPSGNSGCQ